MCSQPWHVVFVWKELSVGNQSVQPGDHLIGCTQYQIRATAVRNKCVHICISKLQTMYLFPWSDCLWTLDQFQKSWLHSFNNNLYLMFTCFIWYSLNSLTRRRRILHTNLLTCNKIRLDYHVYKIYTSHNHCMYTCKANYSFCLIIIYSLCRVNMYRLYNEMMVVNDIWFSVYGCVYESVSYSTFYLYKWSVYTHAFHLHFNTKDINWKLLTVSG